MRRFCWGILLAGGLCAQSWQTATELPAVELSGLSATVQSAVLKMLREQDCNCGCTFKIAECRLKDPQCSYSRALANAVVREFQNGKSADQVYAALRDLQKQGAARPRLLEEPVPLSVQGDPSQGKASAKITIVEFSDFQCPYCAQAAPKARALAEQYPNEIRLVFKQFPLDPEGIAYLAAQASLAAHAQGKFWPLHDKMLVPLRTLCVVIW